VRPRLRRLPSFLYDSTCSQTYLRGSGILSTFVLPQKIAQGIPLGREGTLEETVGAVLFLASSAADYVVGEIIEINGGLLTS
jgi:NAD(P)-dependent dehydrogenase (short-subunit alcohol dehydrogenase family)